MFRFGVGTKILIRGNGESSRVMVKNHDESAQDLNIDLKNPFLMMDFEIGDYQKYLLDTIYEAYKGRLSVKRMCEVLACALVSEELTHYNEKVLPKEEMPIEDLGSGSMLSGEPKIGFCKIVLTNRTRRFARVFCHKIDGDYAHVFAIMTTMLRSSKTPCNEAILSYITRVENVIFPR